MSVKDFYKSHIESIQTSYDYLEDEKVEKLIDLMLNCKGKILFTGIGKNGHVAAKATSTISSIGLPCFFIDAVDSVHGDMGVVDENDILIAVSKSGNTDELINFLHHVNHKNCKIVSIHSNDGNQSQKYCYLDINLHVDREADHLNIVPTSSIAIFTIFLQSVACEISRRKNLTLKQFVQNHPGGSIGKTTV
jgi:arabinose-5-phosphate isomerase